MRVFNPIDGSELATIILAALKRALDEDEQYRKHLTYPLVNFTVEVRVAGYPDITFENSADGWARLKQETPAVVSVTTGLKIQAPTEGVAPDTARVEAGLPVLEREDTGAGVCDVPTVKDNAFAKLLATPRKRA